MQTLRPSKNSAVADPTKPQNFWVLLCREGSSESLMSNFTDFDEVIIRNVKGMSVVYLHSDVSLATGELPIPSSCIVRYARNNDDFGDIVAECLTKYQSQCMFWVKSLESC